MKKNKNLGKREKKVEKTQYYRRQYYIQWNYKLMYNYKLLFIYNCTYMHTVHTVKYRKLSNMS